MINSSIQGDAFVAIRRAITGARTEVALRRNLESVFLVLNALDECISLMAEPSDRTLEFKRAIQEFSSVPGFEGIANVIPHTHD